MDTGESSNWEFSNTERYNKRFAKEYARVFLKVSHLFSETVGQKLPKIALNFSSKSSRNIGFKIADGPERNFYFSEDPNKILKAFVRDLRLVADYKNSSQRSSAHGVNLMGQSSSSSFSQLVHRTWSHKTKDMYLPQLLRRAAALKALEQDHYEKYPVSTSHHRAQSSIDIRADNFGDFVYLPKYPYRGHTQSGLRSSAAYESWKYSGNSTRNQSLARAFGNFIVELHDLFRTERWRGDPKVDVLARSAEPTKQFRIGSGPWRSFYSSVHPNEVLELLNEDFGQC